MFANRFTALVDACSLASTLIRNLLLSLAEAGFFRLRWSHKILDETEKAIEKILSGKGALDAINRASKARSFMQKAFEDAMVDDFDQFLSSCSGLPDPGDVHVLAAALKTQAAVIVTENLKHFPISVLKPLNLELKSSDSFLADTFHLDPGKAVCVIRTMRERFKNPEKSSEDLLRDMEASGLIETVDALRPHRDSL